MDLFVKFIFGIKLYMFSDSSSVHHQEFFSVHTACHTGLPTASEQDQDGPSSSGIRIPLASCQQNLYDIYHCCVYTEKPLMM